MTPAEELRAAAAKLRRAVETAALPVWDRPLDTRYKDTAAMRVAVGSALADLLDTAAEYVADGSPTHPTHLVRALAVARAINGGQA